MLGTHLTAVLESRETGPVVEHTSPRFGGAKDLREFLLANGPTAVVNCMGYTGPDALESFRVNTLFPRVISDCCRSLEALFIQISTNAVFASHESHGWLPIDQAKPETVYELSKFLGEDSRAYVIRASFIGRSPKAQGLYDRLQLAAPYRNRRWNGVTALTLAEHIARIVKQCDGVPTSRMEHVHSSRPISISDMVSLLNSTSKPLLEPGPSKLLAGAFEPRDFQEQLGEYSGWLTRRGGIVAR